MAGERIPEELIFAGILVRLPPQALAFFIFVSKSWHAFIRSSLFIKTHLNYSVECYEKDPSFGYLFYMFCNGTNHSSGYQLLSDGPSGYEKDLDLRPPVDFVTGSCSVVDSCAGLLCLCENDDKLFGRIVYLWNPSVRRIRIIRNSSCDGIDSEFIWIALGCGYDFDKGEFKLVRIIYIQGVGMNLYDLKETQIEVYSLSTDSWRKIEYLAVNWIIHSTSRMIFVNGFINWLAFHPEQTHLDLIVAFDIKEEGFRTIELPTDHLGRDCVGPLLMDYKGMLSFFVCGDYKNMEGTNSWSLWVMREYGVTSSWEKLFNVVTQQRIVWALSITKNCDILLITPDSEVVVYDFKEQKMKNLGIQKYCNHSCFLTTYMGSLLLLDKVAAIDDRKQAKEEETEEYK